MMKSKTCASPIFIFFWLLIISMILVQIALSGRTPSRVLSSGGTSGDRMIGVHSNPSSSAPRATGGSSPTNSAPKAGDRMIGVHSNPSSYSYGGLRGSAEPLRPICSNTRYANCIHG